MNKDLVIDPNRLTVEQKLMMAKAGELVHAFREWVEANVKSITEDSVVPVDADNVRALVFSAIFNEVVVTFVKAGTNPNHVKSMVDQLVQLMAKENAK